LVTKFPFVVLKHRNNKNLPRYRNAGTKGERKYSFNSFLTSALDGGEWSASHPGRAYPWKWTPDTHWKGGWVDLRAGLDTEDRGKKSFASAGDRTPIYIKIQGNVNSCKI
jgi:hypothetical protein